MANKKSNNKTKKSPIIQRIMVILMLIAIVAGYVISLINIR